MPKYFKAVEGRPIPRYGTDSKIGATLVRNPPKDGKPGTFIGYRYDLDRVVSITDQEFNLHRKSYLNAIRRGELIVSTAEEHDRYVRGGAPTVPVAASVPEAPSVPLADPAPVEAPSEVSNKPLDVAPVVESEPKTKKPTKRRGRKKS